MINERLIRILELEKRLYVHMCVRVYTKNSSSLFLIRTGTLTETSLCPFRILCAFCCEIKLMANFAK